jgi:ribonuclease E
VIRGTVGEFIRATLPEAQTRLAEEGVINCFIATIALHTGQAKTADNSSDVENTVSDNHSSDMANQSFNFSNYGYQPLAADYLTRFEAMTQAVSQFAAAQGKTDVEPRTIGKRASNDPRGQHPDYQESAVLSVPAEQVNAPEQAVIEQADSEVDAHTVEATALANQAQTEDVSSDSEQLLEVEHAQSVARDTEAEVNEAQEASVTETDAAEANVEVTNSEEAEQVTESKVEEPAKEDSQAAKSKTTIASYKNMIENVAEQLLPQTGMFNLTTPKVPKARSRKPKTDHKKPTQAEKLASDDSDSDN